MKSVIVDIHTKREVDVQKEIKEECSMNKGNAIQPGDMIGVVAPASPVKEEEVLKAKEALEAAGYRVLLGETCFTTYGGYLAGDAKIRAQEIHEMFTNDEVDAILCLRGGYGTPQLLNLLDYEVIASNPKLFIGYSDITALHIAFRQYANLATVHGPMASAFPTLDSYSRACLLHAMTTTEPLGEIKNPAQEEIKVLVEGTATGEIVGGNLSLIANTLGTPYEIDTKDKILFLEDVREAPYNVDRMLTQLALARKFSEAAGIVLGTWEECVPKDEEKSFSVEDLFREIIAPFAKPTIYNLQIGHSDINIAIPFGVKANLDATNQKLTIVENVAK